MRFLLGVLIALSSVGGARSISNTFPEAGNPGGLSLTWEGPSVHQAAVLGPDGQTYTRLQADGYQNGGLPGAPSLPRQGHLLVVPPQGDVWLEVVDVAYDTWTLDHPVEPALAPAPLTWDAAGRPGPGGWTFAYDAAAYTAADPSPSQFVALDTPVWMREHRLVRLTLSPVRYYPATGALDVLRRVRVRVHWTAPPEASAAETADTEPLPFEAVLASQVRNPSDLPRFRASAAQARSSVQSISNAQAGSVTRRPPAIQPIAQAGSVTRRPSAEDAASAQGAGHGPAQEREIETTAQAPLNAQAPFNAQAGSVTRRPSAEDAASAQGAGHGPAQEREIESTAQEREAEPPLPYKVLVATEGLYALDHVTLVAAGVPVGAINPATLHLSHAGDAVAAQWEGDADAAFEPGERLLFYARPEPTRYAGHDVYWLSWGGVAGARMAPRTGDPAGLPAGVAWATALAEENVAYDSSLWDRTGDRWFWRPLKQPDLVSDTFPITLETADPVIAGQLTVWLQGFTRANPNPDHHVRFDVNGQPVGETWWEGKVAHVATLDLPAGALRAGANTVHLTLPGDTGAPVEGAWVDALSVTYGLAAVSGDVARFRGQATPSAYTVGGFTGGIPRVYDVSDPLAPRVVTGVGVADGVVTVGDGPVTPAQYLILTDDQVRAPQAVVATKTFNDSPAGADYIILTHPDFQAALAPLVAHRAAGGLRVALVDVEAVYDVFGDGRMAPAAIRAFLAHAYAHWTAPAPLYVLLVGDGTYDPRGYRPDSHPTFLPPYLAEVDPWLGETASDKWYADLTGDALPDLRLGRLPVNTPQEAAAVVEKIVRYERDPLPGGWNRRLIFGADNPSTAGDHHADADQAFLTYATPAYDYVGTRVYLSETAGAAHWYTEAETARQALVQALNQGALFYTYFGHASWHQEAVLETDGYAPLFHRDHIADLNNARRWPVVLHMTCLTGRYVDPTSDTLDESLLRTPDVGAVAVWGSSGNGVATGHRQLHGAIYRAVLQEGQTELGAVTHAALLSLYAGGLYGDLIDTYHLFGDPALTLSIPRVDWPFSHFLPIIVCSE